MEGKKMKKGIIFLVGFLLFLFLSPDISYAAESDEKDSRVYFKREKDHWVKVIKSDEGIQILGRVENLDPEAAREKYGPIAGQQLLNSFQPYVAYSVGSWPEAVAIGDVNGDDLNDVVMTTSFYFDPDNDYKLFVFLQNSSGELEVPPVKYDAGDGDSVDIGDLNNDGRNDVVVTNSTSIGVFLQNDTGTLDPMTLYSTTNDALKVRIGDFNNDMLADVASIAWGNQTNGYEVNVFLQNTGGTLNTPDIYTVIHGGYDDLDVGDINNDGLTDIIVMSGQGYAADNIGVLYQNAGGTFGSAVYYDLGGNELTKGVAVGDVNGDDLRDVAVTYGGNRPDSYIGVFPQNVTGTLNSPISYSSYDIPEPVVIGDVNVDQRQDVIVAHGGWNAMGVYLQESDGSFQAEELYDIPYASHYNPHGLAVGDINNDTENDVVIADYNNGLVWLRGVYVQEYSLTIAAGAGGTTNPAPGTYTYDVGTDVSITAVPNSGYEFSGWSGDASGTTNPITITMNSDKSIEANFSVAQHMLTIYVLTGGTTSPAPGSSTHDYGTQVQVTATAMEMEARRRTFVSWQQQPMVLHCILIWIFSGISGTNTLCPISLVVCWSIFITSIHHL